MPAKSGAPLGLYIALGILPTAGLVWAAILYHQGDLPLDKLPSGTGQRMAFLGGLLVALLIVARFTLPPVHALVSRSERGLRLRAAILRGKLPGNRGLSLVLLPLLAIAWGLTYPVRFLLLLAILALLVVIAILTVQLFQPDFLADWLPAFMRPSGK